MPDPNSYKESKRLSIVINKSVEDAINQLSLEKNMSFSAGIRYLINIGLAENGIKIRGNEVV